MTQVDVLVVGAGPTGLATALQAQAHGAHVRVVERRPEAFRPSRAMVVHPRTMENLRLLGVTDALMERADSGPSAELHLGRRVVPVDLRGFDLPDTPFPHLTLVRQADVEEVLAQALRQRGTCVERGVELVDVKDDRAVLRRDGGVESVPCRFVAGCDGQASTVRSLAGIGWRGASYSEEVVLADLELDGDLDPGVLHVVPGRDGLVFVFALGEGAGWRLLATRPRTDDGAGFGQPGPSVPLRHVQRLLTDAGLPACVSELSWSARVPLQHRLATAFRDGRLFLAGDAAHAHSPAGAQGMNTGIQDGVNLGWKLAYAARGGLDGPLLASYELERRPAARLVLAMTHLIFFAEASRHPVARFLRGRLVPLGAPVVPLLLGRRRLVAEGMRMLGQLRLGYRRSPLSVDGSPAGRGPRPGDRLPDESVVCGGTTVRMHALTATPGVHVLASRDADRIDPRRAGVTVHRLSSRPGPDVVAVRPDGIVGFRGGTADPVQLGRWLDLVGAR